MLYSFLFLPHLILIIIFVTIPLTLFYIKKHTVDIRVNKKIDLSKYYSEIVRYRIVKKDAFNTTSDIISFFYLKYVFSLTIFVVSIAFYQLLGDQGKDVLSIVNVISSNLPQELMNWLTVIITMIAMLVAFKKEYYLVFSVADVLEYYKFRRKTLSIICMMVFVKICEVAISTIKKNEYVYGFQNIMILSYFYAVYLCINLIYRVLNVLYSQDKVELQLLDRLYLKSHDSLLISPNCYEENIAGVKINCNYLSGKYLEILNKKSFGDFQNIELQSVHTTHVNECFENIVYMIIKKVSKYLITTSILYLFLELCICSIFNLNFWIVGIETCIAIIMSWFIWGLMWIAFGSIEESKSLPIKQIFNRMFYADNIYTYIDSKGNKKEVSVFGWGVGKKDKEYFIAIINIAIYWKLLIDGNKVSNNKAFIEQLEKNIQYTNKKEYDGLTKILIPICCFVEYIGNRDKNILKKYNIDSCKCKEYANNIFHQQFIKAIVSNISALGDENDILQAMNDFVDQVMA